MLTLSLCLIRPGLMARRTRFGSRPIPHLLLLLLLLCVASTHSAAAQQRHHRAAASSELKSGSAHQRHHHVAANRELRPPRYMLDLYRRVKGGKELNGSVVRGFLPCNGKYSTVHTYFSIEPKGTFFPWNTHCFVVFVILYIFFKCMCFGFIFHL